MHERAGHAIRELRLLLHGGVQSAYEGERLAGPNAARGVAFGQRWALALVRGVQVGQECGDDPHQRQPGT